MKTKLTYLRPLMIVVIILSFNNLYAQVKNKKLKAVPIIENRQIYLNGGLRASLGGKSRIDVKIDLPPKTVQWYYSFTTSPGTSGVQNLNLGIQLASLLSSGGALSAITSKIEIPQGSGSIDAYVCDEQNIQLFLQKVDNAGSYFNALKDGRVLNTKQATCVIDDVTTGTLYLGLKNPSSTEGINIILDIVAIVDENTIKQKGWTKDEKDKMYATLIEDFTNRKVEETLAKAMASCFTEKMSSSYSMKQIQAMTKYEQDNLVTELTKSCQETLIGKKTKKQEEAERYGTLGWKAYERKDIDKCIEYSKKALTIDNSIGWVQANLALCYLVKGSKELAENNYNEAIASIKKNRIISKYTFEEIIKDLKNAKEKYPEMNGYEDILELLIYEQSR